jgi:ferredoxin-NADP reductase
LDRLDNPVIGSVFPFNINEKEGKFTCILRSENRQTSRFESGMSSLSVGNEVAMKRGKKYLSQGSVYCDPIRNLSILASSQGVSPALQIIQYCEQNPYSIDSVDLLWINKNKEEFVCDENLQELEQSMKGKLSVNRLVVPEIVDADDVNLEEFGSYIKPYSYGRVAVACGPPPFAQLMRYVCSQSGYSSENILAIETK